MKNLSSALAVIGILLVIYSVVGRFIGAPTIGLGLIKVTAKAGLVTANSIMLIAIITKLWSK